MSIVDTLERDRERAGVSVPRAARRIRFAVGGYLILLVVVLAPACSTPEIDGVLDCDWGNDGKRFFEVADMVGERIALEEARRELQGLERGDVLAVQGPSGGERGPDAQEGDIVVIRDGLEVAWFRIVGRDGSWHFAAGSSCPNETIDLRQGGLLNTQP